MLIWIIQGLLAITFLLHGFALINPPPQMASIFDQLPFSRGFLAFIGVAEIAGAFGLILPRALNIFPILTPLAAAGLCIIMIGAIGTHLLQGWIPQAVPTLVLALLCAFVALRLLRPANRLQLLPQPSTREP